MRFTGERYNNVVETSKQSLDFRASLMNAAGSLGFFPDPRGLIDWEQFGAFITNPISRKPRQPAKPPRMLTFSGGMLLHTGHPNPGFSAAVRRYAGRWRRAPVPVIVHLLGGNREELHSMLVRLEEIENVVAVEIGLPTGVGPVEVVEVVQASVGELPVIVRLPLTRVEELGAAAYQAGAAAVSLGSPRGALPGPDAKLVFGREYGPGVFPSALYSVSTLAERGIPVIGGGGIYLPEQVEIMLAAGAVAVQLDTVLWRGDWFNKSTQQEVSD
jgi:dihydroorotate dehydrogenase (NAD+) catalytic subunit